MDGLESTGHKSTRFSVNCKCSECRFSCMAGRACVLFIDRYAIIEL